MQADIVPAEIVKRVEPDLGATPKARLRFIFIYSSLTGVSDPYRFSELPLFQGS